MTCPPDSGRQARVPSVGEGLAATREPPPPRPLELGPLRPPHLVSPVAVPLGRRGRTRHAPGPRGPKPGARQGGGGRARRGTPAAAFRLRPPKSFSIRLLKDQLLICES